MLAQAQVDCPCCGQPMPREGGRLKLNAIIDAAAKLHGVTAFELQSGKCDLKTVRIRHVAMFVAWRSFSYGPSEIGRAFRRDHTSVGHALRKIEALINSDPHVRSEAALIEAAVRRAA